MKQHFLWLLIIMIITPFTIYSQNKLPGIVIKLTDDHHPEPLAGANIQWLHDAATGAVTNESGIAVLPLSGPLPQKAVISYVGYIADTILITGTDTLELHLHPDMQLSEVHVTAKKQSNFISSLSSAKTEKITDHELKRCKLPGCRIRRERNKTAGIKWPVCAKSAGRNAIFARTHHHLRLRQSALTLDKNDFGIERNSIRKKQL